MVRSALLAGLLAVLLLGLPLIGVALDGAATAPYLEFPVRTRTVSHPPFSWSAFAALAALIAACLAPFVARVAVSTPRRALSTRRFPAWGYLGLALLVVAWWLAWNRFDWFAPAQRFTFTPLWLGYVVVVNALTWQRGGRCLLVNAPWRLLALFPLSAVFWWFFEYLNRFAQNWYYVGVEHLGPGQYFLEATLAFSTVLPAVVSTRNLLATFPRLYAGLDGAWRVPRIPLAAPVTLLASGLALAGMGVWPELLFPLVWVAPLLVLLSLQSLLGVATVLAPLARGDWHRLWLASLAAIVCGLFWELWNVNSLAKWEYSIPYVHRFLIFEMPVLGYAGYLPFGLQCVAVAALVGTEGTDPAGIRPLFRQ